VRAFAKGLKGLRVYSDNNEMLQRYLEEVEAQLEEVFAEADEFSLGIREDRLVHRGDVVWVDPDRMEGLPFILFRNAFRRLTFERGTTRGELRSLMRAIIADYSRYDVVGEDLVTALWRLQLPHLRYITIDTLTVASTQASTDAEKQEIEQLQADVEAIVAMVYRTDAPDDDIVSGLSIAQEDLEALEDVRSETPEDLDLLDHATERAVTDLDEVERLEFARGLDEGSEALVGRTMDLLVRLLFTERSSQDAHQSLGLLQQLMDTLLLGQKFSHATELVRRLRDAAEDTDDLQKLHIARQLLRLFSAENRLLPLIVGLNDRVAARSVSELVGFLRALGEPAVPALLVALSQVEATLHRRVLRDLIIELGVPEPATLEAAMDDMPGYVVRDLLVIAARRPPREITSLVRRGLEHEHPRVREQATKMLRPYTEGPPDELLEQRLEDTDAEVRHTALRVAVVRKSKRAGARLRALLAAERDDLDPKELRIMTQALVAIEGETAVPTLARWLNPGLLASLKHTDLQVAAALALGHVPTSESARTALAKGTRSLVPKVREACRRALERAGRDDSATASQPSERDFSLDLEPVDSGDHDPISRAEAFETPRPPGPGVPPAATPVDEPGLPPAPPPEASTQVIRPSDLAAAREHVRALEAEEAARRPNQSATHTQLTADLTEDMKDQLPPGSYREVIPDIDVVVPRADRTPTPASSGEGGQS
jgi:SpoVK/Ycf46/Vps4 family AAA+-type ATPase